VRLLDLAEALLFAGQRDEAKKTVAAALENSPADPSLHARGSALLLRLKDSAGAVARARRAVELSQGGDARAQSALGEALAASGDAKGATAAFARAVELEPENAATKKRLDELRRKAGAKAA
jgi:Flp pilus assembly protein TadD